MILHSIDRKIINHLQGGFPLTENPWDELSQRLDIPVDEMICRIERMKSEGVLSRFGPIYNAEKMGGGLTLAAIKVAAERFDEITEIVNSFEEVAHNYARDHELNMWFVIATETPEQVTEVISNIEQQTGLKVFNMPKQEEYFLELKFEV